jgi:hypothetical protein
VKSRANGNPKQKGGMHVSQSPRHPGVGAAIGKLRLRRKRLVNS